MQYSDFFDAPEEHGDSKPAKSKDSKSENVKGRMKEKQTKKVYVSSISIEPLFQN